jgi:alpha-amylase
MTTTLPNATLANSIDNGNIFHAWDWSMSTIKANLDSIKAAGFTTIQTSPMQPQKDYWAGNTSKEAWWKLYQPHGFSIATKNNALGTKSELHSMVNAAHNKGLKVIVDVVANHLAGYYDHFDQGVKEYEHTIYGSNGNISGGAKLHTETYNGASDSWCTKNGNIGLPSDLNTHDSYVQKRVLSLCKKYIDCGVDGFRFDAAKPIETDNSSEAYGASAFWPSVVNGTTSYSQSKGKAKPYYHGEIL